MHVLMISIDKSIEKAGTPVRERMEHYGTLAQGIDIILLGAETSSPIRLKNNVTVHPVSGQKYLAIIKAIFMARRLAQKDTVITTQDPFELGLLGSVISIFASKPLNVQVHIDFFSPYFKKESIRQRFQAFIAPFVIRHASSVRVVSGKIADYVRNTLQVDPKKITIAPVFVDAQKVSDIPVTIDLHAQFPQFDWIVLVASRFVPQKNIPAAIDAFELFKKAHPKAGMVIVGSGRQEGNIQSLIEEKKLSGSVRLGQWKTEFVSCMKTCDTFLLSSDYEGWGMTVIEAASVGKPIVMTEVGCAGEFIQHEKNGLVAPVRDVRALAACLERYYSSRPFAIEMAAEAQADSLVYMTQDESDMLQKKSWESAIKSI